MVFKKVWSSFESYYLSYCGTYPAGNAIRQALRRTDPSNHPIFKTRAYVDPCSPSSSHAGLLKIISLILISSVSRDLRCAKRHFPKTHNEDIRTMIGTGVIIRQP